MTDPNPDGEMTELGQVLAVLTSIDRKLDVVPTVEQIAAERRERRWVERMLALALAAVALALAGLLGLGGRTEAARRESREETRCAVRLANAADHAATIAALRELLPRSGDDLDFLDERFHATEAELARRLPADCP